MSRILTETLALYRNAFHKTGESLARGWMTMVAVVGFGFLLVLATQASTFGQIVGLLRVEYAIALFELAAGAEPERIAGIGCMRQLQRMGEEIADHELPRFAELEARLERDLAITTQIAAPALPATAPDPTTAPTEAPDAAHG